MSLHAHAGHESMMADGPWGDVGVSIPQGEQKSVKRVLVRLADETSTQVPHPFESTSPAPPQVGAIGQFCRANAMRPHRKLRGESIVVKLACITREVEPRVVRRSTGPRRVPSHRKKLAVHTHYMS